MCQFKAQLKTSFCYDIFPAYRTSSGFLRIDIYYSVFLVFFPALSMHCVFTYKVPGTVLGAACERPLRLVWSSGDTHGKWGTVHHVYGRASQLLETGRPRPEPDRTPGEDRAT